MGKYNPADYQATLTNETGSIIQKSILIYIDGRDPVGNVSPLERERIAEGAWFHVIKKCAMYKPSKDAKFITWAKKVAQNFAIDELRKLKNDPLHLTSPLPADEDKTGKYSDAFCTYSASWFEGESNDKLGLQKAINTLKDIVSRYSGRDRTVAEMLIAGRTKEEIMAETNMSSGNVDTCKCRVLKKMRNDLLKAGYCPET